MGGAFVLQTSGTTRVEGSVFVDMTEDASGEIGHLAGGTPDILCFRRRRRHALAEDSAGETPAVPTDEMSGLPLQLRAEGVSQPFHCSLPERATPELLNGVLAALAEIAGKGFLHVSPKVAIVHYHIQFFVNFRRTRVEV